jgi:RNA polymerase sigma-70 factor, ECF subfamily
LSDKTPNMPNTEQFLKLLMANDKRIYAFILTLVPGRVDADDLMQETVTVMWRKFGNFEPGRDFVAWGIGIARYKVLEYRKKKRKSQIRFNDNVHALLEADAKNMLCRLDERLDTLQQCLSKLSEKDRKLIGMRYEQDLTAKIISERVGQSIHRVYRNIVRIHDMLLRCVRNTLSAKDIS